MRQRKAKDLDNKLDSFGDLLVKEPVPGVWDEVFTTGNQGGLYLEIGCGKGAFITKKALDNPDDRFIAIEGQGTVILRALTAATEAGGGQPPGNLKFVLDYVNGMDKFFEKDSLSGVFLNFSDPWPKARHAKRRLTYHERLLDYAWAIKNGGFIEVKTDNDGLFEFTMEELREHCGDALEIIRETRDLHGSEYESRLTMTEYEKKFCGLGKNINYVKVIVNKNKGE